jgi:hypothetical protein
MADKSLPKHQGKTAGKTLEQKRADKKAAAAAKAPASVVPRRTEH